MPLPRVCLLLLLPLPLAAAPVDFTREVQPILSEHCSQCHGTDEKARKGGLRLDVREAALQGGESDGPAIVPGQPEKSALFARISSHERDEIMPPAKEKKPLSTAQTGLLKRWIAEGANYATHWAFDPPKKAVTVPGEHPVDTLVKAKLASLALQPSPRAEAAALCRRLHLDLIGLPPAPAEVSAFEQASALDPQAAVTALTAKLLKSPRYGERWARTWLDAARFADSNGFEKDFPREQWAWRDWVINAFNSDLPYDRFLIEQLAGDLLPNRTQEQIVATGFLRNSMVNEEGAIVPEQFRMDEMFDRMDCLGKAVVGLSLQCAQCHSHKFDPLSHEEYFGFFAFFNNTYEAQSWVYTAAQQKQIAGLTKAIEAAERTWKEKRPQWPQELAAWEKTIAAKQPEWTALKATELGSSSGLNHPTQEADLSILTQGHPTTRGDIYAIFESDWKGVTGLRLEALTHRDLPFNGPGRSLFGTWAVSELVAQVQRPGSDKWEPLKLVNASADFAETEDRLEDEWKASFDKAGKRLRGPAKFLIDGSDDTAWRGDRGPGLRNQEGAAVVQFEKPLDLPAGSKLKLFLRFYHSGDDNGRHNTMLGRCRVSTTTAPAPVAPPIAHAAILALEACCEDGRTAEQQHALFTAWRQTLPGAKPLNDQIAAEWQKFPAAPTSVLHLAERTPAEARPTHLLDRGSWDKPLHVVAPHTPAALPALPKGAAPDRLALAKWLTDRRSPLTARVAVNRVWQALFGSGLVETSEDFGTRAAVPEHQELLDWLAVDFMDHGWSHRHLIQTIVTSATYAQSSRATPAQLERDPRNRLLARGARFRMEAEVIRDSALTIAGVLSPKIGGPSIFPPVPQSVLDYNYTKPAYWVPPTGPDRYARALYVFRKRSMPDPVLSSFDAPNGDFSCARRGRSNTPLSALTSLNEAVFVEAAQALAQRLLREGGPDDAARAAYAYRLCTARPIKPAELNRVLQLLGETRSRLRQGELKANAIAFSALTKVETLPADASPNDLAAWTIISRVLLNLDETLTKS